jgi:hypothetical protein
MGTARADHVLAHSTTLKHMARSDPKSAGKDSLRLRRRPE